jgi:hypothetical protein
MATTIKPKKRIAIPDAEWEVTCTLRAGPENVVVGEPIVMHFADSYLSNVAGPVNLDWCIGKRLDEASKRLKKLAPKVKREKKA